jgi:hypothetical protein
MNPRYIPLHIYCGSISILFFGKKGICNLPHSCLLARVLSRHLSSDICARSIAHFGLLGFPPQIINQCTYCDALLYTIFSSFSLHPQGYSQIFSPATPHLCTLTVKGEVLFNSSTKVALQIFSHTQQYVMCFVNCGHFCRICVKLTVVKFPNF